MISNVQIQQQKMEDVAQISNVKVAKPKSSKKPSSAAVSGTSSAVTKKTSPAYKSPFINIYNDTFIHPSIFCTLKAITVNIQTNPRVVMFFENTPEISINFTKSMLVDLYKEHLKLKENHYLKKNKDATKEDDEEKEDKGTVEEKMDDTTLIIKMLTKVVDHVNNKYKNMVKREPNMVITEAEIEQVVKSKKRRDEKSHDDDKESTVSPKKKHKTIKKQPVEESDGSSSDN